jgi:hypothetical protein
MKKLILWSPIVSVEITEDMTYEEMLEKAKLKIQYCLDNEFEEHLEDVLIDEVFNY